MKHSAGMVSVFYVLLLLSCTGQTPVARNQPAKTKTTSALVGGGCDGCELMYAGMPVHMASTDTSAGWRAPGQRLLVRGIVYQQDGKTPAADVILYYWQTDNNGYYSPAAGMNEKAKRHGHIRGWIKTGSDGRYRLYTNRPAPYPNRDIPAHIHLALKEPVIDNEYYIDEFVFDDDPLLTPSKRAALEDRGGSGILKLSLEDGLQIAEHNIIAGMHIPNYPAAATIRKQSGLSVGENSPSFIPYHAFGPDKGTRTCPVCKYGRYTGVLYFVGNKPDWTDIKKWLLFLEAASTVQGKYLKVYFIYGNEKNYTRQESTALLEKIGSDCKLVNTALTFAPSLTDTETEVGLNQINPGADNTFIIYRNRIIINKFINLPATAENFEQLHNVLTANKE